MPIDRVLRSAVPAAIALLSIALPVAAQQAPRPLAALAFLSGCWRGDAGTDKSMEEHWTAADSDVMLATTRYLDDNTGRTHGWEFSRIAVDSGRVVLFPAPDGNQQGRFRMAAGTGTGEARFEDPLHDYPKRILYRRVDARTLAPAVCTTSRQAGQAGPTGRSSGSFAAGICVSGLRAATA